MACTLSPNQRCAVVLGISLAFTIMFFLIFVGEMKPVIDACSFAAGAVGGVGAALLLVCILYASCLYTVCKRPKKSLSNSPNDFTESVPSPPGLAIAAAASEMPPLIAANSTASPSAVLSNDSNSPGSKGSNSGDFLSPAAAVPPLYSPEGGQRDPALPPEHPDVSKEPQRSPPMKRPPYTCSGVWCFIGKCVGCCFSFTVVLFIWIAGLIVLSGYSNWAAETNGYTFIGMKENVAVTHEKSGMVHIAATNEYDMYFTQGVVHAQQRLWQMEFQRRVGAGTLAEVLGNDTLYIDLAIRTLDMYGAAERAYNTSDNYTQFAVLAYCDGINAYLDSKPSLPMEFVLFGYSPKHWMPADVFVWLKLLALSQDGNAKREMFRLRVLVRELFLNFMPMDPAALRTMMFTPIYNTSVYPTIMSQDDLAAALAAANNDTSTWPRRPGASIASRRLRSESNSALPSPSQLYDNPAALFKAPEGRSVEMSDTARGIRDWLSRFDSPGASNAWVLSGGMTESGKPMIAGDPHTSFLAPSFYFAVHLSAVDTGYDAIGASIPGLPGIKFGRNSDFAWSETSSGLDNQDLFILTGVNNTHYAVNGTIHPFVIKYIPVKVKDKIDWVFRVRSTLYGPIVTDQDNNAIGLFKIVYYNTLIALRWTAIDPAVNDTTLQSMLAVPKARDFSEFRVALSTAVTPSYNVLYADNNGNIGMQMSGLLPWRGGSYDTRFPTDKNADWIGYVPFANNPWTYNPGKGFIVAANNQGVPDSYPFLVSLDWDSGGQGYRAQRITDVLSSKPKFSVSDMKALQLDTISSLVKDFIPYALAIPSDRLSSAGRNIQEMLAGWTTFDASVSSKPAAAFHLWYRELTRVAFGEVAYLHYDNPKFLLNVVKGAVSLPRVDDPACTARYGVSDCLTFVVNAMNHAGDEFNRRDSPEWGSVHQAVFAHAIFNNTMLDCITNRRIGHGGDLSTVDIGNYDMIGFDQKDGPSYRQIIDLGDESSSVFVLPPGQSGNWFSDRYASMLMTWRDGGYFPLDRTPAPSTVDRTVFMKAA